jgi:DNA-directed RNA polymerase sigma subunit (sigma70/sigma32)
VKSLRDFYLDYHRKQTIADAARVAFLERLLRERETRTLADIGEELGVSRQQIHKLERKALREFGGAA